MRRVRASLGAAVCALAATVATPHAGAATKPGPGEAISCGPGDRWCVAVFNKRGRRTLNITGWDLRGFYQVCVTPPGARERCKAFTLVRTATGAYGSDVRLTKHFPHARHGRYAARWIYQGRQLGRTLSFPFPGLK
jgi:hypothetical protein